MPSDTTKKKAKAKAKKKLRKKKAAAKADTAVQDLELAIAEYCELKNEADAIDEMLELRKKRIENAMSDLGLTKQVVDPIGSATFSERRTFTVKDEERLIELMSPRQLAALAKVTADVYDAAKAEEIPIDEAVIAGKSPSLTISRSRKKLAKERQRSQIAATRKVREDRIEQLRAEWRERA